MRVGIVGAGEISQYHIPFTKEIKGVHVAAICDRNRARAEGAAEKFGIPNVYEALTDMLSEANIDVVHILTPPRHHAELSLQAMDAGCHVLVEKPMALTVDDAQKMVAKAREKNIKLSICHVYLFDPMVIKLRNLAKEGKLGKIIRVEAYWFHEVGYLSDAYAFKGGNTAWAYDLPGNVFGNFIDHPAYLVQDFSEDIRSCSVKPQKLGNNPFVPFDEVYIYFEGFEADGQIVCSLNIKPPLNILRIYGTNMTATADISNMTVTTQETKNIPRMFVKAFINLNQGYQLISHTFKTTSGILSGKLKPRQGLRTFIKQFYGALLSGKQPPVSGEQGLKTVQFLSEVYTSLIPPRTSTRDKLDSQTNLKAKLHDTRLSADPKKEQPEKILITGASGFLGGHLVDRLLQTGNHLRVITRKIHPGFTENPNVEVIYGDIRDINCLKRAAKGVDVIFHCAGIVTNRGKWQHFQEINIDATRNLLDLSLEFRVRRFVYVSSIVVYGFNKINGRNLITENDPYAQDLGKWYYYAKSKIIADKVALDYFKQFGLPVTVIRPGILYGPGRDIFNSGKFIIAKANKPAPYSFIRNVVDALILAATKKEAIGQAYNIVDDQMLTYKDFVKTMAQVCESKSKKFFMPKSIIHLAALFFEYLNNRKKTDVSPPLSMYTIATMKRDLIFDTMKATKQLGWTPRVSTEEGLRITFECETTRKPQTKS